jgi:deoxyribodipyrimidine photo-lyase
MNIVWTMNYKRVRIFRKAGERKRPIVYWMSRDQRVHDNWVLVFAQEMALERKVPLIVVFCLLPEFLGATIRQYGFMLKGLKEVEERLRENRIPFYVLTGQPGIEIPAFIERCSAVELVTDFDPLCIKLNWKAEIAEKTDITFYEVDTHNIVPCWIASPKQEYAAYTIRPKIKRLLPEFLEDFPDIQKHRYHWEETSETDWDGIARTLRVDLSVPEVDWLRPGQNAALERLREFIEEGLERYPGDRNDPNKDAVSNLSPYLHFGHISSQRIALEVSKSSVSQESKDAFLEELIIRKELSDNFCFYNEHYDSFSGFPDWAKKTLDDHRRDAREYIYSQEELESSRTHDDLWNAAQMEMVKTGKMHGYMRMYWAKKILEWTETPEDALKIAIYLNDKYELDGRDPNGYVGIAWSIGGVHDRAWKERPIFGKVRYMSYNGCKSKFDVEGYISRVEKI